eukprot:scaffold5017_cov171-Amphora_coffeaeformis.AAC.32
MLAKVLIRSRLASLFIQGNKLDFPCDTTVSCSNYKRLCGGASSAKHKMCTWSISDLSPPTASASASAAPSVSLVLSWQPPSPPHGSQPSHQIGRGWRPWLVGMTTTPVDDSHQKQLYKTTIQLRNGLWLLSTRRSGLYRGNNSSVVRVCI